MIHGRWFEGRADIPVYQIKEPYVLEFLGLDEKNAYRESDQGVLS